MIPSTATDPFAAPGDSHFVLYADIPSPLPGVVAGYSNVNRTGRLASIGHRYFHDEGAHLYFGYDSVIQPEEQVDSYRVTFAKLSIGPLDFPTDSTDSPDPSLWKMVAPPPLPAAQVAKDGDPLSIAIFGDPDTGEVAEKGVRVNAVRPGFIYTEMHAKGGEPQRVDRVKASVPMKRGGQPEEVANAILFLLSEEASYITGTILDVSGGR